MEAWNRPVNGDYCVAEPSSREAATPPTLRVVDEFDIPSEAEKLSYLRARVVEFAAGMPFSKDEIEDIRLAVGEAASNALQHGASSASCRIGVRVENHATYLKVIVSDAGCGFDGRCPVERPGPLPERGRGVACMRAVMDEVTFHGNCPGTSVEMIKYVTR